MRSSLNSLDHAVRVCCIPGNLPGLRTLLYDDDGPMSPRTSRNPWVYYRQFYSHFETQRRTRPPRRPSLYLNIRASQPAIPFVRHKKGFDWLLLLCRLIIVRHCHHVFLAKRNELLFNSCKIASITFNFKSIAAAIHCM